MVFGRRAAALTSLAAGLLYASAAGAQNLCAPANAPDPADALRRMYAAAMAGDAAAMGAEIDADFYAFDGGRRFSRSEFLDLVRTLHASGKAYVWTVTEPDSHIACAEAWTAYVNKGSVTDAAGVHAAAWLESAVLHWRDGRWIIRFFHSTRIPASS